MSRHKASEGPSYDWARIPGVHGADVEAAEVASMRRHAELKRRLDKGHSLRLWLTVPLVIWSCTGMGAVVLIVVSGLLQLAGKASGTEVDAALVQFAAAAMILEVVVIWSAALLIRDRVRPRSWAVILALAIVAISIATLLVATAHEVTAPAWLGYGTGWYALVLSVVQLHRSVRLARVEAVVDERSP